MPKLHYMVRFEEKIVPIPKLIFFTFFFLHGIKINDRIATFFSTLHLTCQVGLPLGIKWKKSGNFNH